ncbi:hypothetical protein LDENG_00180380 [Lucifuga dentata]|nr:hypothetical protein LDENG_00180380 [Lucifuga dentata]
MNNSHQEETDIQETEFGGPALSGQKRIIHFSSGETLEEEEEDSEEENENSSNESPFRAKLSWKNVAALVGRMSLLTSDFLGERLAGLLGLNAAKYQYAIDEYHRDHNEKIHKESLMEGQGEIIHLSSRQDGNHYGATGATRNPADRKMCLDETLEDRNGSCYDRGYREDEDSLK